ncbi:MAG: flagellar filament capping protein FliD [Nocardioidaceae bacterium]
MAATSSVSGLVSGLDTSSLVEQLMSLEAAPQTRLKTRLTTEKSQLSSLQALNTQIAALATKATELAKASSWTVYAVSSSLTGVTGTASTGASQGSVSVRVDAVAAAHKLTYTNTAAGTDTVVTNGTDVKLTVGSTTTTISTDGTLDGLVSALNASGKGVYATTVKLDDGSFRLSVQATATGAAGSFTLTDSTGAALLGGATVVQGADAAVTIGADTVHSSTNTFSGVMTGLDFTVSSAAVGQTATLTVSSDSSTANTKVKAFVDAVNGVLSQIDSLTAYNSTTNTSGTLAGESVLREVRSNLVNAVYPNDGSSLADIGLQTDKYGKLVFDSDKFAAALKASPDGVAARFTAAGTAGYANRVKTVANGASDSTTGTLTASVTGHNSSITRLQKNIDDWTDRLDLRRTSLTRQFTAMETALSNLQSQGNWLSSQISALSSSSSSG